MPHLAPMGTWSSGVNHAKANHLFCVISFAMLTTVSSSAATRSRDTTFTECYCVKLEHLFLSSCKKKRRRARGIGARVSLFTGDLRSEAETTERAFDIDIANITDVLRVIERTSFHKHVVLDDFHHLGRPVQREIIQDFKTIYEKSKLRLIIVGVWADRDQLRGLHIDLGVACTL